MTLNYRGIGNRYRANRAVYVISYEYFDGNFCPDGTGNPGSVESQL